MNSPQSTSSSTLVRWIYTNLVFPIFEPFSFKGFGKHMQELRKRESLSISQNKEVQWLELLKLLRHAEECSPFYQKRFREAGVTASQVKDPSDLKMIPPLTRDDLRAHLGEIRSSKFIADDLHSAATGGTTDTPVPILRSSASLPWKSAAQWRFNSWAGMYPGTKTFYLWGARQDYSDNPSWRWRLYDRNLMRRVWAPTSVLNDAVFELFRQQLNELRPQVIYAYPTPLALFAEYLKDASKPFFRPASIISTAEPLLDDQRSLVESVFNCGVFEHYGSREFGMIAGECEQHNGMHVNPTSAYLEYLPVESSDTPGLNEILVTDLLNYGMPLIRYRANDCAIQGTDTCNCGRGYPLIRRIVGRTGDIFLLRNGDRVPGVSLTNRVLKVCPGLVKTQIIQESLDEFRIKYVPGPQFSDADVDLLRGNLSRFMPDVTHWIFERVDEIPRERSGKMRFCISRVSGSLSEAPLDVLQSR